MRAPSPSGVGRLHILTDTVLQTRFSHLELARQAFAGGADVVQFRHKPPIQGRAAIAAELAATAQRFGRVLVINDHVDIAAGLDRVGLHVGAEDLNPLLARGRIGPGRLLGATVNDAAMLEALAEAPIDYVGIGPVFGTTSKANARPALGLDRFAALAAKSRHPVIAIGSISAERVAEVIAAGAYGVAVLGAVALAADPERETKRIKEALSRAGVDP